jgi:pilus assembly protein CpaC
MTAVAQDRSGPDDRAAVETVMQKSDRGRPLNAYADHLRAKRERPDYVQNQSYAPIKKQDDQSQIPEIEMFVGESRVFPAPGVARIAVGNGQIMTATALDEKDVLIFANAVGTSSLFVWHEDGRYQRVKVNIVPGDTSRIAREVAAFLTTIPNTRASIVGDKVIVEGDSLSDADLARIELLEKRYPQIVNFTNRVGWEQMVMMDVKVVEFPRSTLRDIGMKWTATGGAAIGGIWRPGGRGHDGPYQITIQAPQERPTPISNISSPGQDATAGVTLPSSLNVLSAMNIGINAQLNLLAQDGTASILAEPQLSARNGAKASFLAGGEFPYSVSNANGVTILFKPYGIKLDIEPRVDRNGVIRAKIEAEVSSLDASVSTAAGPALLTRQTNTEFNVRSGETIVLSGLLQRDTSTDIDKVPLLGDIPVLGQLFRSKRFQNKETELVIFVTPTVVDSQSPGLADRVQRTTERLQQQLGDPPYLSNPLQPGHDPANTGTRPPTVSEEHQTAPSAEPASPAIPVPVSEAAPVIPPSAKTFLDAPRHPLPDARIPASGGSTLRVIRNGLRLRAEPTTQSRALLELGHGAIVRLGPKDAHPPGQGRWRNVVVGGLDGWVWAEGVEPSHLHPAIRPDRQSMYNQRDQEQEVLGLGDQGKGIAAESARPVTPVQAASARPDSIPTPERYRVALDKVALRVTPDVNAPSVLNLVEGQLVEALPQAPQGYWIAVQAAGKRGWAPGQWLLPATPQD